MTTTATVPIVDEARRDAAAAADRAGAEIVEVSDLRELRAVSEVFDAIWGRDAESALVPFELLRAMTHGGNYVAAARSDGELVGAAFGFRAEHDGEPVLHSHVLGVVDNTRSRGVGFALKQHQRLWCLERDLATITWTFDPLVRHNAYFNLSRLGAVVDEYLPHFYGSMDDAINVGDSDRVLIRWDLRSERASAGARRARLEPPPDVVATAAVLLADDDGEPTARVADAPVLRCRVPQDVVALRRADATVATAWRTALRDALSPRLADGYAVDGFTRDGWYILSRRY